MIADVKFIKAILDNSPESIVLIGKDHKILAYNETIKKVLYVYFKRDISLGDNYYPDFVVDGSKELYLKTFDRALSGESVTVQHLTENENTSLWFEYRMMPVYDNAGELLGVTLSANNIDHEKRAELRLIESEDKFKKITSLAPIGIIITDASLKINFSNYASHKIFGYVDKELTSKTIIDLFEELKDLDNGSIMVGNSTLSLGMFQFENERLTGLTKTGERVSVLLSSSMYYSGSDAYHIFLIQDISELLIKDEKIISQTQKLQEIAWFQSHVIRAPLSNILGLVNILQDVNFTLTEADRIQFYKHLLSSANELDGIIRQIVDSSSDKT